MTTTDSPIVLARLESLRRAARQAQWRYTDHANSARRCDCATGGLCDVGRDLDRAAESAYTAISRFEGDYR